MKGKVVTTIISIGAIIVFGLFYLFWPQYDKLPDFGEIEPFQIESVFTDSYNLDNDKVKLVAFFYTNCPDICPLTMLDFMDLQRELQEEGLFGKRVELVAISIDPENDTKSVIRDYASNFHIDSTGWFWLRGTSSETKQISDDFQMYYERIDNDYMVHGTRMYLLDEDNHIRAIYDMANRKSPVDIDQIFADMLLLVN